MHTVAPVRRLSPKVRRLLEEHGLEGRSLAGTGAGGRITARDVLAATGVPPTTGDAGVLASPAARRVLREAGIELAAAARASGDAPITRARAERIVGDLSAPRATDGSGPAPAADRTTAEVDVDVARLLAAMAAVDDGFLAHHGFTLTVEVAVASAAGALLVQHPELADDRGAPVEGGGTSPSIHVGFVPPDAQDPTVAVVPDVQYLTVAGLARRARAVMAQVEQDGPTPAPAEPTVVVAPEALPPRDRARGGLGLLTVGDPAPRRVTGIDDLGHEVVRTRPHVTLRLHHDPRTPPETARAFLDGLGEAVTSWVLPVGP